MNENYVPRKILINYVMEKLNINNYFTANSIVRDILKKFNIEKKKIGTRRSVYNYDDFIKIFDELFKEAYQIMSKFRPVDNSNLTKK